VKSRLTKTWLAFITLRPVLNALSLSGQNRITYLHINVTATLFYGLEIWKVTQALSHNLQSFVNKERKILKIHWMEKMVTKNFGVGQNKSAY